MSSGSPRLECWTMSSSICARISVFESHLGRFPRSERTTWRSHHSISRSTTRSHVGDDAPEVLCHLGRDVYRGEARGNEKHLVEEGLSLARGESEPGFAARGPLRVRLLFPSRRWHGPLGPDACGLVVEYFEQAR